MRTHTHTRTRIPTIRTGSILRNLARAWFNKWMQITCQNDDKALNKYSYVATFYSQAFYESIIGLSYIMMKVAKVATGYERLLTVC